MGDLTVRTKQRRCYTVFVSSNLIYIDETSILGCSSHATRDDTKSARDSCLSFDRTVQNRSPHSLTPILQPPVMESSFTHATACGAAHFNRSIFQEAVFEQATHDPAYETKPYRDSYP